jgi:hypothetical protein
MFLKKIIVLVCSVLLSQVSIANDFGAVNVEEINQLRDETRLSCSFIPTTRLSNNELFALFLNCQRRSGMKRAVTVSFIMLGSAAGLVAVTTSSATLLGASAAGAFISPGLTVLPLAEDLSASNLRDNVHEMIKQRGFDVHISSTTFETEQEYEDRFYEEMMTAP